MTRAATEFVGAVTFEALTGRPVHTGLFDAGPRARPHQARARARRDRRRAGDGRFPGARRDRPGGRSAHRVLLAANAPVLLVPAMNDRMWAHAQTRRNVAHLRELGYRVLDPDDGMLAAGEGSGPGRMPEPETIFAHVGRLLESRQSRSRAARARHRRPDARGDRSGALHLEPQQRQDGRRARRRRVAARRARSTLVAGPLDVAAPVGRGAACRGDDRRDARRGRASCCREPTSWSWRRRPPIFGRRQPATSKIKKTGAPRVDRARADAGHPRDARRARGATARSSSASRSRRTTPLANATRRSSTAKELDLIVVNDATEPGAGFGVDTNRVTLLARDGREERLPLMTKTRSGRRDSRPRGGDCCDGR